MTDADVRAAMESGADWRAIPHVELDATLDKWLFVNADGSPLDPSPEAERKRREWAAEMARIKAAGKPGPLI